MYYCDDCGEERGYHKGLNRSRGLCEICKKFTVCNDVPSKHLPYPDDANPNDIKFMWENYGDEMAHKWLLEKGIVKKI